MDTQLDAELRANILVEALPYIQEYYGQTVVVKYGGNAMINDEAEGRGHPRSGTAQSGRRQGRYRTRRRPGDQ